MLALAMFFDFGPLGPMVLFGILALLGAFVFLTGVVVGVVIALLFLRRRKSGSAAHGIIAS